MMPTPTAPPGERAAQDPGPSRSIVGQDPGSALSDLTAGPLGRGRKWTGTARLALAFSVALLSFGFVAATSLAQKAGDKPRVPPGIDPGGVAVAIIGGGIDYTRPEIAARLARDGEGEIIGWDFVDNDRRPYAACKDASPASPCLPFPRGYYENVARVITLRVSSALPKTLVQAVQMANQMAARIVLIALPLAPSLDFLQEASRRHPQLYFVAAVDRKTMPAPTTILAENYVAIVAAEGDEANAVSNAIASGIAASAAFLVKETAHLNNDGIRCAFAQAPDFVLTPGPRLLGVPPKPPGCR